MQRLTLAFLFLGVVLGRCRGDGPVIDPMEEVHFQIPKDKGQVEQVKGKVGKAVRFTFRKDAGMAFFVSNLRGKPDWDQAAGLSFWVKGDGSDNLGCLHLIYDDDYAVRYDFAFPLKNTDWKKVTVAWRDLVPVMPGPKSNPLDPATGNKPSKISSVWLGRWWYWRDYPAESFAIDDLRLEEKIPLDRESYVPEGLPLARVRERLRAGKPITLVTMGDSLTDTRHWSNHEISWPVILKQRIKDKYHSEVTIINPAIGGTQLRQNLVLIPLWQTKAAEPDLVTVCFGNNDWEAGMRGEQFRASCQDAVERIRRATRGKSDVLLMTTVPTVARWRDAGELAEACRQAAKDRNAGLADTEKAFLSAGKDDPKKLFAWDKTHLGLKGQTLTAETVLLAIEAGR